MNGRLDFINNAWYTKCKKKYLNGHWYDWRRQLKYVHACRFEVSPHIILLLVAVILIGYLYVQLGQLQCHSRATEQDIHLVPSNLFENRKVLSQLKRLSQKLILNISCYFDPADIHLNWRSCVWACCLWASISNSSSSGLYFGIFAWQCSSLLAIDMAFFVQGGDLSYNLYQLIQKVSLQFSIEFVVKLYAFNSILGGFLGTVMSFSKRMASNRVLVVMYNHKMEMNDIPHRLFSTLVLGCNWKKRVE